MRKDDEQVNERLHLKQEAIMAKRIKFEDRPSFRGRF